MNHAQMKIVPVILKLEPAVGITMHLAGADEAREATRGLLSLGQIIHIVSAAETVPGSLLKPWLTRPAA